MAETIAHRVREVIWVEQGIPHDEVSDTANFYDDLGMDSLDHVELVMAFENEFGITIEDEDAEQFTSVQAVVAYVQPRAGQ